MDGLKLKLLKPTLDTKFHIDYDWWRGNDRNWKVYLRQYLCSDHQEMFADMIGEMVDWIDPETAEVKHVDGMTHILDTHCTKQDSFITQQTTLVDSVFKLFLANDNQPQTIKELAETLSRPPQPILRVLSGPRVYKGIRPIFE